jgi:hypothetical protein
MPNLADAENQTILLGIFQLYWVKDYEKERGTLQNINNCIIFVNYFYQNRIKNLYECFLPIIQLDGS